MPPEEAMKLVQTLSKDESSSSQDSSSSSSSDLSFLPLLFDFGYLKNPESCEQELNASDHLVSLEESFVSTTLPLLSRFYSLFSSIVTYHQDLTKFLTDLDSGYFIQHTLDSLLQDTTGKQLLLESVYLLGSALLLLERHIPGYARERLVIAYYRYAGGEANASLDDVDKVCKLVKDTKYRVGEPKPRNYEARLFKRVSIPTRFLRDVLGRLMTDDVYLRSISFPSTEHRSIRLGQQGAMLYVALFFDPDFLSSSTRGMREIVDRYFNDNWVLALYMGHVVDLTEEWASYPAAKKALDNVITAQSVRELHVENARSLGDCMAELRTLLTSGLLTQQYVLDNTGSILSSLRSINAALKWRIMHRRCQNKEFHDIICSTNSDVPVLDTHIMTVLLNASQLEMRLKDIFKLLLQQKSDKWTACKSSAVQRMKELSEYFTGEKALTRVKRDDQLIKWFTGMANEIDSLSIEDEHATVTGRKIQHCVRALEDVEQFDVIDTNLSIKAFLKETRDELFQMVRACNIKTEVLTILETVTDFSYAWEVMLDYVPVIHERVKSDPSTVVLLRALFLKLASILDVPMIRTMQCNSPDAMAIADYYSNELVNFVRNVMDIIPVSVFKILTTIVNIKEKHLKPIPTKVEVDQTKTFAQLNERYELARATHQVSIFTEGILAMEQTLLGVIQVDPRAILEDGLRKELVRQMSSAMHSTLRFPAVKEGDALACHSQVTKLLTTLSNRMTGYKLAIEYVQDYVDISGLKMFQHELSRITNYNTEQECNRFLKKKILDSQSKWQSRAIPVPRFAPVKADMAGATFMGRTVGALLRMTDSTTTIYSPECGGWFTSDGTEVFGVGAMSLLRQSTGVSGLLGVDRLLCFRIVNEMNSFFKFYKTSVGPYAVLLEQIRDSLFPEWKIPDEAARIYSAAMKKSERLMLPILTCLRRVGQAQLLRKQIATELQFRSALDANVMHSALMTFDESIVGDFRRHYRDGSGSIPREDNPMLEQLNRLLDANGASDPMAKIYVTTDPLEGLPVLLLLFSTSYIGKFVYDVDFGTLRRGKSSYPLDGWPVVAGMACLLKQFHPSYTSSLLAYMGQFVRCTVHSVLNEQGSSKAPTGLADLPREVQNTVIVMHQLGQTLRLDKGVVEEHLPQFLAESVSLGKGQQ